MSTRTFWVSFCDGSRPKGQQFLGVAIIDLTAEDLDDGSIETLLWFPHATEEGKVTGAVIHKAWQTGCNPGGEVAMREVTDGPPEELAKLPRHKLLSKGDLLALRQVQAVP